MSTNEMEGYQSTSVHKSNPVNISKPTKLRAACNACFAAKVKCEGNKSGCARCVEKRLNCHYSESRVGKVVGKRRKRPLDDSIGMVNSDAWLVNTQYPPTSVPSPTNTYSSEASSKRSCTDSSWTSFIADDAFESVDEQYLKMSDCQAFSLYNSEMSFPLPTGLPTPALSPPPQFRFLSPMVLESRPQSSQGSATNSTGQLLPPRQPTSARRTPEPQAAEDAEMVCIRLLAHVKRQAGQDEPLEASLNLMKKTTAALTRILQGKSVHKDYSCQMLLSSIMIHLVTLCEQACQKWTMQHITMMDDSGSLRASPEQLPFANPEFFNQQFPLPTSEHTHQDAMREVVKDVWELCSSLGDLLKRKPLQGFQAVGRHESLQLDLGRRLKICLTCL